MLLNRLPFIVKFQGRNRGIKITIGSISSSISISISISIIIISSSSISSSSSGFSGIKGKGGIIENQSAVLLLVYHKLVGGGLNNGVCVVCVVCVYIRS